MKNQEVKNKNITKKPIYKKWWFWLIIVIIISAALGNNKDSNNNLDSTESSSEQVDNTKNEESTKKDITFSVSDVPNDVTGNWRIATIAENIQMEDYALDYYKKYFKNDSEIHAIVNFNYNTTTKILVLNSSQLDVCVYDYVDKEEHDAKLLFSGTLLSEFTVDKQTGEIEKIR